MRGLTFERLVGAIALLGILLVLAIAALLQGNHDALVALISLVTGAGIGIGTSTQLLSQPSQALAQQVATESTPPSA